MTTLKTPFDLSEIQTKPRFNKHNLDEYGNHYRATIHVGMRVLRWSSYDYDHLQARIDAAGYRTFVTCYTIEKPPMD